MAYLLDTSICVFFLRGKMDLDKTMKEKGRENCYISEFTISCLLSCIKLYFSDVRSPVQASEINSE